MSRTRRRRPKPQDPKIFWGDPAAEPDPIGRIRTTPDPSALLRSLGDPPLAGGGHNPLEHLALAYVHAVDMATALAKANGILDPDDDVD